ncbi:hypothetical protein Tco_1108839 [Tanacetum coccineum]
MWESARTIALTLNSAIVRPDVDDNFVINTTHLKMIREHKFDGYLRADPHDHIHEFLAICDMFKYGETQSEAAKLLMFPLSLSDNVKTWFNELNEESITSWEQMRRAFINIFFPPSFANKFVKDIVYNMNFKMRQNEKNFQTVLENMETKISELSKSQNHVPSEQPERTDPLPPPLAQVEHVNAVFTRSGKSDELPKTQKDPPPPIIVNNKIRKDQPFKTTKREYHVVQSKESTSLVEYI